MRWHSRATASSRAESTRRAQGTWRRAWRGERSGAGWRVAGWFRIPRRGGGGLVSGIATAVKALRPGVRVFAAEPETAAPLAASLAAGEPREVAYVPTFVDGCGSRALLAEMWPIVRRLVDGSLAMPVAAI